jgi:uncharacterized repeat protein (TIGR02543 family)
MSDVGPNWIEQWGIRWTFDKNISLDGTPDTYRYGRFVNGDYWVLGDVVLTSISPSVRVTGSGELDAYGRQMPAGVTVNGAEINPIPGASEIGYHQIINIANGQAERPFYNSALNAALVNIGTELNPNYVPVSNQHPRIIPAGSSLVSTTQGRSLSDRTEVYRAAILTVLPVNAFNDLPTGVKPENCFRPAYCGTSKKLYHTQGLLERAGNILQRVSPVPYTPDIQAVAAMFKQPFLEHPLPMSGSTNLNYNAQYIFPMEALESGCSSYGREYARDVGIAALMLNLDPARVGDKTELLIGMIQAGIDLSYIALGSINQNRDNLMLWRPNGGHIQGQRVLVFMAALFLEDDAIVSVLKKSGHNYLVSPKLDAFGNTIPGQFYGLGSNNATPIPDNTPPEYIAFGEEQFFYVSQLHVDLTNRNGPYGDVWGIPEGVPYRSEQIGMPDWATDGRSRPHMVSNDLRSMSYRVSMSNCIAGNALAILMMGGKALWAHDPYIDYADRWMEITKPGGEWALSSVGPTSRSNSAFTANMWDTYRANYGAIWPNTGTAPTTYTLTVNSSGASGVVISSTTGHGGTTNYIKTITSGTSVTLTAPATSGSMVFSGWSGAVTTTTASVTITMNASKTVTANYVPTYTLTVNSSGASSVAIASSTGHGGTTNYTKIVTSGTSATLTAPATSGSMVFTGWSGAITATTASITITMNGNKSITANFGQSSTTPPTDTVYQNTTEAVFSGASDYEAISTSGWRVSDTTITMWANPSNLSGSHYILGHTIAGGWSSRIQLYLTDSSLGLGLGDTHFRQSNLATLQTGQWTFISLSWNGTNYTVQVNGQVVGTGSYTGLTAFESFADIGNNGSATDRTEGFAGIIDDIRVYGRSLSIAETTAIYNYGRTATTSPAISTQPVNRSVTEGQTASFSVAATGSGTLTYQWQKNQVNVTGATASSYTTPTLTLADNGSRYRCIITNAGGSTTSSEATLTVTMRAPVISTQPVNRSVTEGQTASFSVAATGSGTLTYQWQKNQVNITGATAYTYTTPTLAASDNGNKYRCIVTNAGGFTNSNEATLTLMFTLSITATSGTVTKKVAGIATTATTFAAGTVVELTAATISGYTFSGWSGSITGTINPISITMNGNKVVTADFTALSMDLSMTAHWMLDENTGSTVTDSTSAGRTAALINNPSWGFPWANEDWINLDNQTQAIAIPASALQPLAGSIAVWVEPDSLTGTQFILGHVFNSSNRINLYSVAGKLALGLGANAALQTNLAVLAVGQPAHIALTWNGTLYAVYVNAVLKATGTFEGLTALNTTIDVGNYGDPANRTVGFVGVVEDIRTYCRALSGLEIQRLYYTYDVYQQKSISFSIQTVDSNGLPVTYQPVSVLPAGAIFESGIFSWQPWYNQAGNYSILFIATGQPSRVVTIMVHDAALTDWYKQFLIYTDKLQ